MACIVGFLLYHNADIARNVGGMWDNLQKMGFCGTGCTRILYAPAYIIRLYNELSLPLLWAGCVAFHDAPTYSPTYGGAVSNTDPIHKGVC